MNEGISIELFSLLGVFEDVPCLQTAFNLLFIDCSPKLILQAL